MGREHAPKPGPVWDRALLLFGDAHLVPDEEWDWPARVPRGPRPGPEWATDAVRKAFDATDVPLLTQEGQDAVDAVFGLRAGPVNRRQRRDAARAARRACRGR